jgi:hypothetical protein
MSRTRPPYKGSDDKGMEQWTWTEKPEKSWTFD